MSKPFIEEEFISALNAVLGRFYPMHRLRIDRISSWDEKGLGYDGTVTIVKPIYIQFKRSEFYQPNYSGSLKTKRNSLGLTASSFYSFKLHRDSSTSNGKLIHKQHNLLYNLSLTQQTFYLAPIFHTKAELDDFNFSTPASLPTSFDYDFYLHSGKKIVRSINRIDELIFADTIGVIPHKLVTDKNYHKYTFDKSFKVAFHSEPELVEKGGFNFLNYLLKNLESSNETKYFDTYKIFDIISSFCEKFKITSFQNDINEVSEYYFSEKLNLKEIKKTNSKRLLHIVECYLKDYFDIHQYVIYK